MKHFCSMCGLELVQDGVQRYSTKTGKPSFYLSCPKAIEEVAKDKLSEETGDRIYKEIAKRIFYSSLNKTSFWEYIATGKKQKMSIDDIHFYIKPMRIKHFLPRLIIPGLEYMVKTEYHRHIYKQAFKN